MPPSPMPLVSLIVPVFNTETELTRCLSSIEKQSYRHLEILVVNDGSTDRSPEIAQKFCARDPRFRLLSKSNGGLSDARNFGLERAQGEYCCFVDSDDAVTEAYVEKLLACAMKLDADMAICVVQVKDAVSGNDLYRTKIFESIRAGKAFTYRDVSSDLFQGAVVAWNKIYRAEFLRKSHLHFLKGLDFEDLPFFAEAMIKARWIGFVDEVLYDYYLMRPGSLTEKRSREYLDIPVTLRHAQNFLVRSGAFDEVKASFLDYKWERMLSAYVMIKDEFKPQLQDIMKKELALDSDEMKKLGKQIRFG